MTLTYEQAKADAKVTTLSAKNEAEINAANAASDRRIREQQAKVALGQQRQAAAEAAKTAAAQRKATDREERAARRVESRKARAARRSELSAAAVGYVRSNAPAVYSAAIYGMAVAVAVSGQIDVATSRGWNPLIGIGMAGFIEGLALVMALTAHAQRLKGERALVARTLTWVAAGFAAGINAGAHADDPVMAAALAASSLAAIIVWEVRSGAKHRDALRAAGLIPEPPERFGWRRWCRYPVETFRAWSLDIRTRVGINAATLIGQVQAERQAKHDTKTAVKVDKAAHKNTKKQMRQNRKDAKQDARERLKLAKQSAKHTVQVTDTGDAVEVPESAETATVEALSGTDKPAAGEALSGTDKPAKTRRTGTPKARKAKARTGTRTDTELIERLADVPRDDDGTVPVRRAARELKCGPDRARRLLSEQNLLTPAASTEEPEAPDTTQETPVA